MGINHKIAVAITTNRLIKPKTVLSLANLLAKTKHEVFPIVSTEGYTIAENRSYCVYKAIKAGCTHLLFIDDDMTFPDDTIERLLSHEKMVVGVNSHSRMLPITTTVAFIDENGELAPRPDVIPEQPFKCYQVGMGVALINLDIFNKIPQPWFKFEEAASGQILNGEDGWFCDRVRDAGYEIWCDPTLPIGHIGDYEY